MIFYDFQHNLSMVLIFSMILEMGYLVCCDEGDECGLGSRAIATEFLGVNAR